MPEDQREAYDPPRLEKVTPQLGLVTTEEIIEELHSRMVVSSASGRTMDLDYTTVRGDDDPERLEERASELLARANVLRG